MFSEEAPTFDGRYYRIHRGPNVPPPVQPGGPTILVGGGGEKRTLQLVARYADMCNIFGDVPRGRPQGRRAAWALRAQWVVIRRRSR